MTETRNRILASAEPLIAEKGFENSTIASIARAAGVADSLVYQYFKNKQDLLFSVARQRFADAQELLEEQLQGIIDPASRLSKMIWFGLRYNDQHPGYLRILLFECRSNKDFYASDAYQKMRSHAAILSDILNQGVTEGFFRDDLERRAIRDLVYGTLDAAAIGTMATRECEEGITDFDAIMALLMPMLKARPKIADLSKEERIMAVAEEAFSRKGFARATVAEIAGQAQVAEGTIYEYFQNKEDLLFSLASKHFSRHQKGVAEIFDIRMPLRRLRRMMRYHFTIYLRHRDFLKIFLTQIQFNLSFYNSKAYDSFRDYLGMLESIVAEGVADGSFRADVNPRVFRNMFLGAFSHMAIRWILIDNHRPHDQMGEIDHLIDLLSLAVLSEEALASTLPHIFQDYGQ